VGGGIDNLFTGVVAEEVRVITGAGHAIVAARGTLDGVNEARVDFGDGSGLGDTHLSVQEFSTVTLAEDVNSSPHTVVVEDVDVNSGAINKPATPICGGPIDH
jgi:hypothetical protein